MEIATSASYNDDPEHKGARDEIVGELVGRREGVENVGGPHAGGVMLIGRKGDGDAVDDSCNKGLVWKLLGVDGWRIGGSI